MKLYQPVHKHGDSGSAADASTDADAGDRHMEAELPMATGGPSPLIWYGYFQWFYINELTGGYCGEGDALMRQRWPCATNYPSEVIAPFASGGLDVRSRRLAEAIAACDHVWSYLDHLEQIKAAPPSAAVPIVDISCDGTNGYLLACVPPRCHLALPKLSTRCPGLCAATVVRRRMQPRVALD